ncbi:hypothetical protein LTR66_015193 [Elasticomyces elasticus]|nr:hypothetical protein LTR66_015193 [Elasticomyces elasticus]
MLDTSTLPSFPEANVSLDDVLAETRRRSSSQSSRSSSDKDASSRPQSPISPSLVKTRLRAFSLRKKAV